MHEIFQVIWYILIAVLWIGWIALEALTCGPGLLVLNAKTRKQGGAFQMAAGPYWDGTQVWFITAAGATFAAFPLAYAEMFSTLYNAIFLILAVLIIRGVSIEFLLKDDNPKWYPVITKTWFTASLLLPILMGVYFTNLFFTAGTIEAYSSNFLALLTKWNILGAVIFVCSWIVTGAYWMNIKTKSSLNEKVLKFTKAPTVIIAALLPALMFAANETTNLFGRNYVDYPILFILPALLMVLAVANIFFALKGKYVLGFFTNILTLAMYMIVGFVGVFPYLLPGYTAQNASSSELTLKIMLIVTVIFLPIVLLYTGWKFYRFRAKIEE